MLGWKVFGNGLPGLIVQALCQDAQTSLTASGTTQGTALELVNETSDVTTVASGAGVVLSSKLTPGDTQYVFNAGANSLKVYPPSGMKINSLATDASMTLGTSTGCLYKCVSTTRVMAVLSA